MGPIVKDHHGFARTKNHYADFQTDTSIRWYDGIAD